MRRLTAGVFAALSLAAGSARAQDRRTVVEPKVPPACVTLEAALVPAGDSTIADSDEHRLDTHRLSGGVWS